MRLAAFITANIEAIARDWEQFAATLLPKEEFSSSVLRDGIVFILTEIAADMNRGQSAEQQKEKSEGDADSGSKVEDAAEQHAVARVKMGLSSRQLIAEFRALRATVIRLWQRGSVEFDKESLYDLTRFNEAVDQVLSDAAVRYTAEVDRSRDMFLGILGHDLRNPLGAISGLAELQLRAKKPDRNAFYASQILVSAARMAHMVTDLIELTRVRLGTGIVIKRAPACMRRICVTGIEEMKALYPNRVFRLVCDEDLPGAWDDVKISQVLSNLLGNAIQHGAGDTPITVSAKTGQNGVELAVHNMGPAIPAALVPRLFDCLVQGGLSEADGYDNSTSLGLGLYIAKEIILAHGGTIDVRSTDAAGTTFTVILPATGN